MKKYQMKVFAEKSLEGLEKELKQGFKLTNNNSTTIILRSPSGYISVWKEIDGFNEEKVKSSEINWGAIGSVSVKKAEEFNQELSECVRIAKFIDSNFKTEIKEFKYKDAKEDKDEMGNKK